ncbi:hypothetical protein GCM10028803_46370 [Larkinella knui]|uniref:HEAT repeat domain-containing protein n=1 Tax=Larkinella knui TaxID=2025310 RepID=UPI00163AE9D5|nr:HEAT repeat domain-containing protein [Larkinella knui]
MIDSAREFIRLRNSEIIEEYTRAAHEEASLQTWKEVIELYPDYKTWVIHNKTVPLEILEELASDPNSDVRSKVARKRKISPFIIEILANDPDEEVRYALACNTKISLINIKLINRADSDWLKQSIGEIITRKENKLT